MAQSIEPRGQDPPVRSLVGFGATTGKRASSAKQNPHQLTRAPPLPHAQSDTEALCQIPPPRRRPQNCYAGGLAQVRGAWAGSTRQTPKRGRGGGAVPARGPRRPWDADVGASPDPVGRGGRGATQRRPQSPSGALARAPFAVAGEVHRNVPMRARRRIPSSLSGVPGTQGCARGGGGGG